MKAAIVRAAGQAPVYADFADPVAGEGEEVITVTASALSQVTRGRAAGAHYSSEGHFPLIPGIDGVGRRDNGERIFFFMPRAPYGTFSERTIVRRGMYLPLSDDLDDVTAAAIANPGVSSWAALTERAGFSAGQTVLVNGATGISGQLAVQIARRLGAGRVIATGRNPEKLERLRELGADAVIPLLEDDDALEERLKAEFSGGVDVVLDYLWGRSARVALIAAARAGDENRVLRFVSIGSVAGPELALPSAVLRSSRIELLGSGLGSIPLDRLVESISALLAAAGAGRLTIATKAVPLAEVETAWAAPDDGRRIVFTPGAPEV